MNPEWTKKLWIDFPRDRAIESFDLIEHDDQRAFTKDTEDLEITNHSTVEYLQNFL